MGNKQALKDMEMNILVWGEYITFKYTKNLLGYTEIKVDTCKRDGITYAKMLHPSLGWEFLVNENPFEVNKISKCVEFFKMNYLNGIEKNTFIILVETLRSEACKVIIQEFSEMTKIYHPFLIFVTKDNSPDKKIINEYIVDNGLRFDKRNVYVHQYNDENVTDIYFSLLKICSYYNELGDFFNFPVKLNEKDIHFLESNDESEATSGGGNGNGNGSGNKEEAPAFNLLLQNEAPHIGNEQGGDLLIEDNINTNNNNNIVDSNVLIDKPIDIGDVAEDKMLPKEDEDKKEEAVSKKHPFLFDPDNDEERENHLGTFNILVTGRPGVGKSTIINLILGEKRCRENQGRTVTRKIVKYVHKKYPLCLFDTPGFDSDKEINDVISIIKKFNEDLTEGRNQIHAIFFLINSESARTFIGKDEKFIQRILHLETPIYFLLTRSQTEKKGQEFADLLQISIKQVFGNGHRLLQRIFPVQLLEEKSETKHIKPFGVNNVFNQIFHDYEKDKIDLTRFEGLSKNDDEKIKDIINKSSFFKYIQTIDDVIKYSKKVSYGITGSYCLLAGAIGASPIPIADWFLLTPIQVSMIMAIAAAFGRFKNKKDALSIVKSMGVNIAVSGVARGIASIMKVIPGVGTIIGVVVDVTVSGSATGMMGISCMKIFEKELRDAGTLTYMHELSKCYNNALEGMLNIRNDFYYNK